MCQLLEKKPQKTRIMTFIFHSTKKKRRPHRPNKTSPLQSLKGTKIRGVSLRDPTSIRGGGVSLPSFRFFHLKKAFKKWDVGGGRGGWSEIPHTFWSFVWLPWVDWVHSLVMHFLQPVSRDRRTFATDGLPLRLHGGSLSKPLSTGPGPAHRPGGWGGGHRAQEFDWRV